MEDYTLKEKEILIQILSYCYECSCRLCCKEQQCVLFRVEKIIEGQVYEKNTDK